MNITARTASYLLVATLAWGFGLGCASAQTAAKNAAVVWHCWYDGKTSAQCELGRFDEGAISAVRLVSTRLPEIVHAIARSPGKLKGQRISIPLHTIPFDIESVRELAIAVMCAARTDCEVRFGTPSMVVAWELENE